MTLIAILLALATERYWRRHAPLRIFRHLAARLLLWRKGLIRVPWLNGVSGALLLLVIPLLPIAAVQGLLGHASGLHWEIIGLIFSTVILALCIGDRWYSEFIKHYLQAWRHGDVEGANHYLQQVTGFDGSILNARQLNRRFLEMVLERMLERVLAVLFWFVVLGPLGAVGYRLLCQMKGPLQQVSRRPQREIGLEAALLHLKAIMEWLPVRLAMLVCALTGSYADARQGWRRAQGLEWVANLGERSMRLLRGAGLGALQLEGFYAAADQGELSLQQMEEHVEALRDMIKRVLIAWMAGLSLLTLTGWLE
ncbi:MAG: regulatory signaling modulator protein AmpE [Gammaproteobacteria bacterium]|nr:regulatory signaling modulator protein AmpE [Gammaproteobacteria bacterium]